MGYTTEELQVPINLRISNLQAVINELQNNLSNLKVGSKGFKDVEGIISKIRNEMDRLQVQTSKPFINQRQFVTAERSIDKIEDGLSQAQLMMSRIKFSDLNLNSEQTAQIKAFNDEIANIKNNIKNVKEITKQNFFGTDIGKSWLGIDPNAINQSLQQITTSITTAFSKQTKAVEDAEAKLKEYQNAVALKTNINDFLGQLKSVNTVKSSRSIFDSIYDSVFTAQGKFQTNGQTILARWLSEQFQLDESSVSSLIQGTASQVIASLKSGQLQELITSKLGTLQQSTSSSYGVELKQQLEDARSLLNTLTPIYNGVANSQLNTSEATKKFEEELRNVNTQLDNYKQKQAEATGSNSNFVNAIERGKQHLQQFKDQLQQTETNFLALERTQRNFQSIKMLITNFMGFTQVLNLVKTGVRNALNHIKELDTVMNKIAIVTNLSNSDLWKQIDAYSEMSQKYGVSIKGAYEVSQIYYQQGLQTKDVLTLTNETLKLSKISGLDYAQTTDYMTTALRGFKMEMSEASTIVDVYSNLAAHTAVSQEELAVAMSKTASSLESVGATFQESSAMISTMVAVTRESATNIGSAMKSIAARYGEMKSNPSAIEDIEGEAIAYNKVDAALQSVGISLKDTDGQFRNFTDVIIELGEKWDSLESTQQRYIATQFAGNRQQSRFLALISNVDLLKSNLRYAEDSEDVGDIQALKALDSIETKLEQVKVAYQEMYTTIGVEDIWKGALDGAKNFMNTLNGLPKLFGKIPVGAIAMVADLVKVIKDLGFAALGGISKVWASMVPERFGTEQGQQIGEEIAKGLLNSLAAAREALKEAGKQAADSVASGATEQSQDKNTLAGKQQTPEQSTVKETAQTVSEDNVTKIQTAATASTQLSGSVGAAVENMGQLADKANEVKQNLDGIAEAANNATTGLAEGIAANTAATTTAATKVTEWLTEAFSNVNLEADNTTITSSMTTMAAEASDTLKPAMEEVGKDGSISIAQGLLESQGMTSSAAASLATSIITTIRSTLNMHSPSPTIIAMFENGVGEAIALGLTASQGTVESAATKLGLSVSEQLKEAFENSDKINLSDHFEVGQARELIQAVTQSTIEEQQKELSKLDKRIKWGYGDREIRAQRITTENSLVENIDTLARMKNIQYENIPVTSLYMAHNFKEKYLRGMTGWGGVIPQPSTAVRATNDKVYSGYGGATAFLPGMYADPTRGLAALYRGDAATPVIMSKPGEDITLEEAHARLNRHDATNYDLETNLLDMIRDASKLYSISQAIQQAKTITSMPFGASPYGDGGAFRLSGSINEPKMDAWEANLNQLLTSYISKTQFDGAKYDLNALQAGAEYSGREAYNAAMYQTANEIGKADFEGVTLNIQEALSQNLYNAFKDMAKIDISSAFGDSGAQNLINESLKYIQYAFDNPKHDYAEAKVLGDVNFKDLAGLLASYNNLSKADLSGAFQAGLDPKKTFLYDAEATSGPLSREAIADYMMKNVPGIAFDENGPLVSGDLNNILNIDQLKDALSAESLNLPPVKIDAMIDVANSIADSDMGQVLSNTLKAALSNVDFDSADASAQVTQIIQNIASQMTTSMPELQSAGAQTSEQVVAGLALGLSSGLAEATSAAQGAGQAIIAALNSGAGVSSPSIFAFSSGKFIMLGLTNGMMAGAENALDQAMKLGKDLIIQLDTGLNNESDKGTEKIKNRLRSRLATLTEVTDEEKAKIQGAINNLTWNDYVKAKRDPFKAGIEGNVTEEGLRYVTSHPILEEGSVPATVTVKTESDTSSIQETVNTIKTNIQEQLELQPLIIPKDDDTGASVANALFQNLTTSFQKEIDSAKQVANESGSSVLETLKARLTEEPLDLAKLITFTNSNFDASKLNLSQLDIAKEKIQERISDIQQIIKIDPNGYSETTKNLATNLVSQIDSIANQEKKLIRQKRQSTAEYKEYYSAKKAYNNNPDDAAAKERLDAAHAAYQPVYDESQKQLKEIEANRNAIVESLKVATEGAKRDNLVGTLQTAASVPLADIESAKTALIEQEKKKAEEAARKEAEAEAARKEAEAEAKRQAEVEAKSTRSKIKQLQAEGKFEEARLIRQRPDHQDWLKTHAGLTDEQLKGLSDKDIDSAYKNAATYTRWYKDNVPNASWENADRNLAMRMHKDENGLEQLISGELLRKTNEKIKKADNGEILPNQAFASVGAAKQQAAEVKAQIEENPPVVKEELDITEAKEKDNELKESIKSEPIQQKVEVDKASESTVESEIQMLLNKYKNNTALMFKILPDNDEQLRLSAQHSANPELRYDALKQLSNVREQAQSYDEQITALTRLKELRVELNDIDKKSNPDEWKNKNVELQEQRRAVEQLTGNKINPSLGTDRIQAEIDKINNEKLELILHPKLDTSATQQAMQEESAKAQIESNPEAAADAGKKDAEIAKEATESAESAKPKIEANTTAAEEAGTKDGQAYTEAIKSAESAQVEDPVARAKRLNPTRSWDEINSFFQEGKTQAPTVESPVANYDMSGAIAQIQSLIDSLIKLGVISEEEGAKLKASLEGASPEELTAKIKQLEDALHAVGNAGETAGKKVSKINFGTIGSAIRMLANISGLSTQAKGAITALGGAITLLGVIISMVDKKSKEMAATNPWMAIAMGVMGLINGISQLIETPTEKLERLNKEAEELNNKAKQLKSDTKELSTSKKQYEELEQKRYDSAEAAENYQEAVENLTEKFPNLIKGFDEAGNAILDANKMEQELVSAREKSAQATYEAAAAELAALKDKKKQQIKTAAQAGDQLETYNSETGEYSAVHHDAYITYNKNAIDKSMPEWMRSSHIANGTNSLEADLYGGLYTPESLIGSWFYWMANNVDNYWDVQGAKSEEQQKSILAMFEGLAPYITYSETGAESIDYAAAISYLEGIKDKTLEQDELLSFLKDFVQITSDINTANTTNNGNTTILKELVTNGKITNEKIVARVLDESQASDDIAILNDAIKQYNTIAFDENSTTEDIVKAYNYMIDIKNALDENVPYLSEWMKDNLDIGAVGTAVRELEGIDSDLAAAQTRLVSSWFDTKYYLESFIKDSSGFKSIISSDLINQAGTEDITTWLTTNGKQYADGLISAAETFWTSLGDESQESFKNMLNDTKSFSAEDIINTFDIQDDNLRNAITNYYSKSSEDINKRITKKLESDTAEATKIGEVFDSEDIVKIDTVAEEKFFNSIMDNLDDLVEHGYEDAAEAYRTSTEGLFDSIESVSAKTRAKILSLISENGINTKEGINKTIDAIKSDETIPEADKAKLLKDLDATKEAILSNLRLELQVATDSFLESWKDGSKTLSKLSSGIDISDVNSLIQSEAGKAMNSGQGLSLDDFMTSGDKLVLQESKVDDYITQYFANEKTKLKEYADLIDKTIGDATWLNRDETSAVTGINHEGGWDTTEIEELKKIAGIDIADYAKLTDNGWVFETVEKQQAFNKAVQDGIKSAQDNAEAYGNYLNWATESITKTRQWEKGNYSSLNEIYKTFSSYKDLPDYKLAGTVQRRLKDLVSGIEKMTDEELKQPDIGNAVKQIRSAYDTYISDLISKDINTLYAEDYVQTGRGKALIKYEMSKAQDKTATEFAQWIGSLAQEAGQTISEQNDAFIQAFDKIQARNSLDGIQDVQFLDDARFAATSNQLKTFADTYQLSINEMISKGLAYYDEAMSQWVVNYASLDSMGLNLDSIDGFKETVADSINNFFKNLGNTIKSALDGSLSNVDARTLQRQAEEMGFEGKLDFSETAEGLKLSEQSAISLYHCLEQTNSLQAQLVFKELRASLEESNEYYKTIASTQARIVELQNEIDGSAEARRKGYQTKAANVNLYAHAQNKISAQQMQAAGWTEFPSSDYATLYSSTYTGKDFGLDKDIVLNITPITNDGKEILSPQALDDYVQDLMENSSNANEIKLNDTKHLVMGAWDVDVSNAKELANGITKADLEAERLHEESAALSADMANWDKPSDARIKQYEEELSLAKQIAAERATTEDSSFDFMNNDIPAAQNNPITYYENWGKAWKTLQDSFNASGADKGLVGYKDFYNIITEMGHIAEVSGQPIKLGAETFVSDAESAAALIEKGAGCLTVATDGSIQVDLSKFGMDFVNGADDMASNIDDGIKAIAKSQIAMLDNMIKLLETIVAMEQLGNIDVDNDNEIDLGEIFKVKYDEKGFQLNEAYWDQFTEKFQAVATKILQDAENNEDLATALKDVVVNGHSLHEMFQDAIDGTKDLDIDAEAYTAVMNAFYRAAISGDYDLDNIMQSVKDVLAGTGFEGTIEIGDYKLTYQYGVVLEEGEDGKYHVGNKTFDKGHEKEAARATAIDSLDTLKNAAKEINEETGEVTVTSKVVTKIDYDATNKEYTIDFGDGYTATATSKAGADLAIATYAKLTDKSLDESGTVTEPVTFTLYQNGEVKTVVTLNDGEVTVDDNNFTVNDKSVKDTAQQVIDEKKKEAEASAGQINDTIDVQGNLTVKVAGESQITLDLTGKTLKPEGLPESIELTAPVPKLTYPSDSAVVEVTGLKGSGTGTLELSDCKLQLTQNGTVKVLNGETEIAEVPVGSLKGTGILTDCTFTYNATSETITVTNTEGQAITEIPLPAGLKGNGELSGCTITYNPSNDSITLTKADGTTITEIPLPTNLSGTGTLSTCKINYNPTTGTCTINNGEALTPFTIPSEQMSASGVLTANNCKVTLNSEGLTITSAEGKVYQALLPTEVIKAVGEVSSDNCIITMDSNGQLTITTAEGEQYTVLIPSSSLFGMAELLKADVLWSSAGEKFNTDAVEPTGAIDLGTVTGTVTMTEVQVENGTNIDPYEEIRKTLYGAKLKNGAGYTLDAEVESALGIGHTFANHYNTSNDSLKNYLTSLKQLVSTGQTLGTIDLNNLKTLGSLQWDDTSISSLISDISETNNWNLANLNDAVAQVQAMSGMDATGLDSIATSLERISTAITTLTNVPWTTIVEGINSINASKQTSTNGVETTEDSESTTTITITADDQASEKLEAVQKKAREVEDSDPEVNIAQEGYKDVYPKLILIANAASNIPRNITTIVSLSLPNDYDTRINNFIKKIKEVLGPWTVKFNAQKTGNWPSDVTGTPWARGNFGMAMAAGGTLMGELGPELVVQKGRYFVVGQGGAEFVNLSPDAIVFNHLQTEQLLKHGMSSERGRAVTNERIATAYATGNVNGGPAMASASAALSALKQLRAQWQSLLGMSVQDLAGKGGGGGGGGGGGDIAAFIKQLERWYNLLQEIATLEEQINYQEKLRSKIASDFNRDGREYYNSQKESLENLKAQVTAQKQLVAEQEAYFKQRQAQLNQQSAFSELYTFDDNGQIKYKTGKFTELSQIFGADSTTGKPNNTVEEQYNWLLSNGYGYAMQYDNEGNAIEVYKDGEFQQDQAETAIQAFWDKIEADKEEMQDLHDSIEEHKEAILEAQEKQNEILKEIEDNQITLENRVLDAIEDTRQREIDELQDQTDAIRKSNEALINGLSNQLEKERTLYENKQNATDLESKRRRLSILQRSGGSAAEINSLKAEIDDAAKEQYFAKQQEQIDALQEASDAQLERLDNQISLMEEQLEYEKEHGLLWDEVKEIMEGTPEEITQFITDHDSSYWGKSVTQLEQESRQIKFEAEQWAAFQKDGKSIAEILAEISANTTPAQVNNTSSDSSDTSSSASSSGAGSGDKNSNDKKSTGGTPSTPHVHNRDGGSRYVGSELHDFCTCGKDMGPREGSIAAVKTKTTTTKTTTPSTKTVANAIGGVAAAIASAVGSTATKTTTTTGKKDTITKKKTGGGKAGGGYVGHGFYELGELGTETVLTASQTKILRDNILSNRKNSLISLLKAYNENYDGISSSVETIEANSDNSITIQHAEVNVRVDKLANSYDAARAGDDIMREMVNIARKTRAQNRIGR